MGLFEIIFISIGLSMDAFAVSICKGLNMQKYSATKSFIIAFYFGFFQAIMPLIGWCCGLKLSQYFMKYAYIISFILLLIIGIKMIIEVKQNSDEKCVQRTNLSHKELLALAIATSIDALAVGFSFSLLKVSILKSIIIIGITTFIFSVLGVKIGNIFGAKYKSRAEVAGGIILIVIGLKIILEHFVK